MKKLFLILMLVVFLVGCTTPTPTQPPVIEAPELPQPGAGHLTLATTTSTQDSGLLDYILPDFEALSGVKVDVIAVGTGQALKLGEDGNADVLLVHSRANENVFMEKGHGVRREDVMYNDFVILGPESDPAGIKGITDAAEAFKKLAETQSGFISRGDESGTHSKEKSIWKKAEIEPAGDWYISAGQGMGEVISMANEQLAYTLSDRATYLARTLTGLDLVVLVEGDKVLFNPYGVIAVNPEKNPNIQVELAQQFIDWLVSLPVQEKIATFGVEEFGQSLFTPDSTAWRETKAIPPTEAPIGEIAFKITGKVTTEQAWSENQIKAMRTISVDSTNSKGEKVTHTGVSISELLKLANPLSDATTIVFVIGGGYTAEMPLADIMACTNCIITFRTQGGFSTVLPGFSLVVVGLIEIQVK